MTKSAHSSSAPSPNQRMITVNEETLLLPKSTESLKYQPEQDDNEAADTDNDDKDESYYHFDLIKEQLLERSDRFTLMYDVDRGYRAKEVRFFSFKRPHMRAFHASWICCFTSFFVQFSQAPLLPEIKNSLNLTNADIWWTNLWMMVGGVPMRFLLGPLCDKYGSRTMMVTVVALAAIPCALTGYVAVDVTSLTAMRFLLGAMDSFVPSQCWITCQFVREVGGTAMAVTGGLGASGAGVTQLVTGSLIFPFFLYLSDNDTDWAWRVTLIFPALLALVVAWFFYRYSDDCPLGNFDEVKKAGLMMERSAVDSFRAGVYNLNSWILGAQFAGSCGVDFTMCNGAALFFHFRFHQSVAASGAMAFMYGISAIYARGIGGWLSDAVDKKWSLRGRLWAQLVCMLVQGGLNIWFARTTSLVPSLLIMVVWSIVIQMSMGTNFGIVPYVDSPNTGSVAGIVGAGGNFGGALLGMSAISSLSTHPCNRITLTFVFLFNFLCSWFVHVGGALRSGDGIHGVVYCLHRSFDALLVDPWLPGHLVRH
jgi:NNP family nitrate/nitrite transporter-like MFS transporter